MSRFLSQEWAEAIAARMNEDEQITGFAGWAYITLEHVATGTPSGEDVHHWRRFADGVVSVGLGAADSPDATLTTSYEDAVLINRGELDIAQAFSSGRLAVAGDVTKLLQYQGELAEVAAAVQSVDATY